MNIGVFDSGIGGVTLLHRAMLLMPHEKYIFYADMDHVPYGTKSKEQVIAYVEDVIQFLTAQDCKAVVLACNTATAVAADIMRSKYALPIIGIEPAVKPAVAESAGKRVLVVATPLTVQEKKLKDLLARVDDEHLVDLLALPHLVEFAERGEFVSEAVTSYLRAQFAEHVQRAGYPLEKYGELVLGCTHFNYFKDTFRKLVPGPMHIIDGSLGTVRQLAHVLEAKGVLVRPLSEAGGDWEANRNNVCVRYFESGREVSDTGRLAFWNSLHERLEKCDI